MATDLVSVVIPTYNYGHFVEEAVESALSQTYTNIEVIVVDDGSTDDTGARLSRFGDRIRYHYQQNRGLSAARNAGIRQSAGEWIALLDSDDVWHSQKIERQLEAASVIPDVALIGSPATGSLPKTLPLRPATAELHVRDFLLSNRTGPSGTMIRRHAFDSVGLFDEALRSIEDRDMWLRVASRFRAVQVKTPCWWYRPHEGQMSRRASRMLENYRRVLIKFFNEHPEHRRLSTLAWSYLHVDAAWAYYEEGDLQTARRMMARSFAIQPWPLNDPEMRRFARIRLALRLLLGRAVSRA